MGGDNKWPMGPTAERISGFGREGENPAKDRAYRLLDVLGKGASSDFIIAITNEWIDNQKEGTTNIPGSDDPGLMLESLRRCTFPHMQSDIG